MSKPLKALRELKQKRFYSNGVGVDLIDSFPELFDIIEQALTSPTAEEVCQALSNYIGKKVYYSKEENNENLIFGEHIFYYFREIDDLVDNYTQAKIAVPIASYDLYSHKKEKIIKIEDLPIQLIMLIGRFYESLEDNE